MQASFSSDINNNMKIIVIFFFLSMLEVIQMGI